MDTNLKLGPRFSDALMYAAEAHADQTRKGGETPYLSHLLAVAGLVMEYGADEDEAIAALLHDAVEDQGGLDRLDDIRARYGHRVADIVAECTDTHEEPKPAWEARKEAHVEHLRGASEGARLVVAADKIHNARAIAADFRAIGDALWGRFNASREQTLWYYRAVADVLCQRGGNRIFSELNLEVVRLEALGNSGGTGVDDDDGLGGAVDELVAPGNARNRPLAAPVSPDSEAGEDEDEDDAKVDITNAYYVDLACRTMYNTPVSEIFRVMNLLGVRPSRRDWETHVIMGRTCFRQAAEAGSETEDEE